MNVLEEAGKLTDGARRKTYGHPRDNHGNTAAMWSAFLSKKLNSPINARDVCMMMVLLKVSRESHQTTRDNLTDICGYARNAEMIDEAK